MSRRGSWATSRCASLFPGVKALTQTHTLGPRVVGGGMGLHRARRSLWHWGQARRSSSLEVERGGVHTQGLGEAEPMASVFGEAEPALKGQAR